MNEFLRSNRNSIMLVFLTILVLGIVMGTVLITQNNSFSTNTRAATPIIEGVVPNVVCGGMGVGEARCEGNHLISYVERNGKKYCKEVDCDKDCYMKGICQDCVIDKKNGKGSCKKRK